MNYSAKEIIKNSSFGKEVLEVHELELMDLEHPCFMIDGTKLNDLTESEILECHPLLYTICACAGAYSRKITSAEFTNVSKFLLTIALDTELDDNSLTKVLKDARVLDNLLRNGAGDAIEALKVLCRPDYIWLSNPLIRIVSIAKSLLTDKSLYDTYMAYCDSLYPDTANSDIVNILKRYA